MQNPIFLMKKNISEKLNGKKLIAVYSGKGGVGKTSIASNLAILLSNRKKTALVDMDINGANVASYLKLDSNNKNYNINEENTKAKINIKDNMLIPIEYKSKFHKDGNKLYVMSISFLSGNEALLWRGPLLTKAVDDLLTKVDYSGIEYIILDLPPGTSDIPLTLMQMVPINKMIIVSTPHDMALIDAEKSLKMAQKMSVNVMGIIENMSGEIFGREKSKALAMRYSVDFLGSIELSKNMANGELSERDIKTFEGIIDRIIEDNAIDN
jgi:ATP-binding protein involved in chromosome partitioning